MAIIAISIVQGKAGSEAESEKDASFAGTAVRAAGKSPNFRHEAGTQSSFVSSGDDVAFVFGGSDHEIGIARQQILWPTVVNMDNSDATPPPYSTHPIAASRERTILPNPADCAW